LDLNGKVVGINTAISTEGQGIGFAVSADTAVKVVNDLIQHGYVRWAYLVWLLEIRPQMTVL